MRSQLTFDAIGVHGLGIRSDRAGESFRLFSVGEAEKDRLVRLATGVSNRST